MATKSSMSAIPVIDPALKKKQDVQEKAVLDQRIDYIKTLRDAIFVKSKVAFAWTETYKKKFGRFMTELPSNDKAFMNISVDGYRSVADGIFLDKKDLDSNLSVEYFGSKRGVLACGSKYFSTEKPIKIGQTDIPLGTTRVCMNPRKTKVVIENNPGKGVVITDVDPTVAASYPAMIDIGSRAKCFMSPTPKNCDDYAIHDVERFAESANILLDDFPNLVSRERAAREKRLSESISTGETYKRKAGSVKTTLVLSKP
jgi:hypothetical protein